MGDYLQMNEPTIACPNCKTEIKLTESLAAPLIQATRLQYEKQLADKEAAFARREVLIRDQQLALSKAKDAMDEQVAEKLKTERERITIDEAKKARLALGNDLDQKIKEVAELSEIIRERDVKLADAQKVQAELMKKQRELDDEKHELDLTIEKRVQGALEVVHARARLEAEDGFKHKVTEKRRADCVNATPDRRFETQS
jgi:hypothetical protein